MTSNTLSTSRSGAALALVCLALQVGAAQTTTPAPPASAVTADAVYQRERAACNSDATPQGRTTCLKEAGAAHAEAKRQLLGNGEGARALQQNAETRCDRAATADREHCLRKARGEGTVSGSVDGGGLLKTLVTPVPAPAASR
jgi:hypothetical protein